VLAAGSWVLGSAPRRYIVISDRDPDWTRVRQACPVRKGYISVGRGFVGHGTRAEAHLIEWSRGKAHLIERRSGKEGNKGKQGKDARRVASLSVNVQRVLSSSSSFSTLQPSVHVHRSDILTRFLPVQHHPTSPARALTYPHLCPVSPGPSTPMPCHPVSDPVLSSYLLPFSSLAPPAAHRHGHRHTATAVHGPRHST
jgi:hypothetical protein